MTTFETITIGMSVVSMLIATYSIMSAIAAKRSALAAETQASAAVKQADHAETQANAALAQVKAADQQVEIMRRTMTTDLIGTAIKARRIATDLNAAITDLRIAASRGVDGNARSAKLNRLEELGRMLEDVPPVFPENVRQLTFHFINNLEKLSRPLALGAANDNQIDNLKHDFDRMLAGMNVAIEAAIATLREELRA